MIRKFTRNLALKITSDKTPVWKKRRLERTEELISLGDEELAIEDYDTAYKYYVKAQEKIKYYDRELEKVVYSKLLDTKKKYRAYWKGRISTCKKLILDYAYEKSYHKAEDVWLNLRVELKETTLSHLIIDLKSLELDISKIQRHYLDFCLEKGDHHYKNKRYRRAKWKYIKAKELVKKSAGSEQKTRLIKALQKDITICNAEYKRQKIVKYLELATKFSNVNENNFALKVLLKAKDIYFTISLKLRDKAQLREINNKINYL